MCWHMILENNTSVTNFVNKVLCFGYLVYDYIVIKLILHQK